MNPEFLRAVVDTLLPGEVGLPTGAGNLPSGSIAGVDLARHLEASRPALEIVAKAAGGAQRFADSDEASRVAILASVQGELPEVFARLLGAVLPDYYEAPAVLIALGWRSEPPQPQGHIVPDMDEATRLRLERVRLGGQRWRKDA